MLCRIKTEFSWFHGGINMTLVESKFMQSRLLCGLVLLLVTCATPVSGNLYNGEMVYTSSTNEIISLDNYEGKYLVVDAMATWCAPCRLEMLHLQEVYDVVQDTSEVSLLSISMDPESDTINDVGEFMEEFNAVWDYALDHLTLLRDELNVTGYPTTFIVSPDGEILTKWLGLTEAEIILEELDQYLDLPGSLARQLDLSDMLASLVRSPLFFGFMIVMWALIITSGLRLIRKYSKNGSS